MIKKPTYRKLRGYAFDPSLSLRMDTASINDIVYKIPWEDLIEGPIGEYVEVIDYDPTVGKFYQPVNLDNPFILATDGLDPSESNPLFHQQMVYAVTMLTIKNFEKALGRKILWSSRRLSDSSKYEEPVWRLRIYPHALREANAYYSPIKKALLFGYFGSTPAEEDIQMPDSLVFTCLSHDIIAHETTHAILDGLHNSYNEPTNPDMLAFHEAFADIVALFQHFTFPEVLKHQIAKTKGELVSQNLLGQLAQQFGNAIGGYGSLRDAIGEINEETKEWRPKDPNPEDYRNVKEPHARGSILVAAIFEAFLSIYKSRIVDLLRIASEGTGILRQGEIHPDLVNRLANEAAKSAGHVLGMCIRALDYCSPVDLTFGEYLRAIITADADLIGDDSRDYRLAFIDAFRKRGIYPEGIKTLSVESLRFRQYNLKYEESNQNFIRSEEQFNPDIKEMISTINKFLKDYADDIKYVNSRKQIYDITRTYIRGGMVRDNKPVLGLHKRIDSKFSGSNDFSKLTGLAFLQEFAKLGIRESAKYNGAEFQIQNLRLVNRVGPEGNQVNQVVFSIYQRSGVQFKNGDFDCLFQPGQEEKKILDKTGKGKREDAEGVEKFEFMGGCTLIFDLDTMELKYVISKPIIDVEVLDIDNRAQINMRRIYSQYEFQYGNEESGINEFSLYFGNGIQSIAEPFAFLHQH